MTQPLQYPKTEIDEKTSSQIIHATADDAEVGSSVEVDIKIPDKIKQKTKYILIRSEFEKLDVTSFTDNIKKHSTQLQSNTPDWSHKGD